MLLLLLLYVLGGAAGNHIVLRMAHDEMSGISVVSMGLNIGLGSNDFEYITAEHIKYLVYHVGVDRWRARQTKTEDLEDNTDEGFYSGDDQSSSRSSLASEDVIHHRSSIIDTIHGQWATIGEDDRSSLSSALNVIRSLKWKRRNRLTIVDGFEGHPHPARSSSYKFFGYSHDETDQISDVVNEGIDNCPRDTIVFDCYEGGLTVEDVYHLRAIYQQLSKVKTADSVLLTSPGGRPLGVIKLGQPPKCDSPSRTDFDIPSSIFASITKIHYDPQTVTGSQQNGRWKAVRPSRSLKAIVRLLGQLTWTILDDHILGPCVDPLNPEDGDTEVNLHGGRMFVLRFDGGIPEDMVPELMKTIKILRFTREEKNGLLTMLRDYESYMIRDLLAIGQEEHTSFRMSSVADVSDRVREKSDSGWWGVDGGLAVRAESPALIRNELVMFNSLRKLVSNFFRLLTPN